MLRYESHCIFILKYFCMWCISIQNRTYLQCKDLCYLQMGLEKFHLSIIIITKINKEHGITVCETIVMNVLIDIPKCIPSSLKPPGFVANGSVLYMTKKE